MGKDGKYMICTLATIAMSFTDRCTMANCAVAAKAMVTKITPNYTVFHMSPWAMKSVANGMKSLFFKTTMNKVTNPYKQTGCVG